MATLMKEVEMIQNCNMIQSYPQRSYTAIVSLMCDQEMKIETKKPGRMDGRTDIAIS